MAKGNIKGFIKHAHYVEHVEVDKLYVQNTLEDDRAMLFIDEASYMDTDELARALALIDPSPFRVYT